MSLERERLQRDAAAWRRWGPYLSERAWGTVREDYSPHGEAWDYFSHDHARSRVYRWSEDGLAGICDNYQRLCFALALWNGNDPILKERLFGLTGSQGNHGEDVKEYYFYLDSTPTHSYMKMLYKYPQFAFPYARLVDESARRSKTNLEFELLDTGMFADNRYFDVLVEYAKASPDDILVRINATNRGRESASVVLLPTLWFRNTWSWGLDAHEPSISEASDSVQVHRLRAQHPGLGEYELFCENADEVIFTNNETNNERLFNSPSKTPYVKDAFHEYVIRGNRDAVNPKHIGTKAAACYKRIVEPNSAVVIRLQLTKVSSDNANAPLADFDSIFTQRRQEADDYYAELQPSGLNEDFARVQRQAFAGMLWSKQYYHYDVEKWLQGDPNQPAPSAERKNGRNHDWEHLNTADVLSMPDK